MIKCRIYTDEYTYSSDGDGKQMIIVGTYDINPDTQCVEFQTADKKYYQIPLHNVKEMSNWEESDRVGKQ